MISSFEFALNADDMHWIAVSDANEIDTVLSLTTSAIPLDIRVTEKATPEHHGCALEGLMVRWFGDLCGGE